MTNAWTDILTADMFHIEFYQNADTRRAMVAYIPHHNSINKWPASWSFWLVPGTWNED